MRSKSVYRFREGRAWKIPNRIGNSCFTALSFHEVLFPNANRSHELMLLLCHHFHRRRTDTYLMSSAHPNNYEISYHFQTSTERKGEVISFYVLLSFYPLMRRFSFLHHYERKCGFFFFDYYLSSIPLILYYQYTGYLNILVLLQRFRESKECIKFFFFFFHFSFINIS